jgi:flagellar basal body-associated protein FliL
MENTKTLYIIIAAVVIVVILAAGYYFLFWQKSKGPGLTPEEQALEQAGEAAGKITESATQGTLPSMDVGANPLEEVPDINPAGQANPFKNIKTNPFE